MDNFIAHILVVDDDDGIRSLVKKYLNENNYLVTTANNAENALEKIKNKPLKKKLELFSLKNRFKPGKPLLLHDEPIYKDNKIVGYSTSSNYSFCYNKNICLAYIHGEINHYDDLYIEVEGDRYALKIEKNPLHDPLSKMMRS